MILHFQIFRDLWAFFFSFFLPVISEGFFSSKVKIYMIHIQMNIWFKYILSWCIISRRIISVMVIPVLFIWYSYSCYVYMVKKLNQVLQASWGKPAKTHIDWKFKKLCSLKWFSPKLDLKLPIILANFLSTGFCISWSWTPFLLLTWYGSFLLQLLELSSVDLISKGNAYISSRQNAANKLLDKVFKVRLGRGFYGECLVIITHCILDFHAII